MGIPRTFSFCLLDYLLNYLLDYLLFNEFIYLYLYIYIYIYIFYNLGTNGTNFIKIDKSSFTIKKNFILLKKEITKCSKFGTSISNTRFQSFDLGKLKQSISSISRFWELKQSISSISNDSSDFFIKELKYTL